MPHVSRSEHKTVNCKFIEFFLFIHPILLKSHNENLSSEKVGWLVLSVDSPLLHGVIKTSTFAADIEYDKEHEWYAMSIDTYKSMREQLAEPNTHMPSSSRRACVTQHLAAESSKGHHTKQQNRASSDSCFQKQKNMPDPSHTNGRPSPEKMPSNSNRT